MTAHFEGNVPDAEPALTWQFWEDCWPNLAGLLGANLLFLAWCAPWLIATLLGLHAVAAALPLVTVGPALLGLFTYAGNLVLGRKARVWHDSLTGFRRGAGAAVGAMVTAWALVATTADRMALMNASPTGVTTGAVALWAGQTTMLIVLMITGGHTLGLMGMYHQRLREAFRNAVLLVFAHPAATLTLAGAGILAVTTAQALRWGPLVILPALLTVLSVRITRTLIQRHRKGRAR